MELMLKPHPGGALLHPLPAFAALLILWNDFWLRAHHPGFWSGKLSDLGICFLFPILLAATGELLTWCWARVRRRAWAPPGLAFHLCACLFAAAYYSALELSPQAGLLHELWLGAVFGPLTGRSFRAGTADPTDLMALVLIPLSLLFLRSRISRMRIGPGSQRS